MAYKEWFMPYIDAYEDERAKIRKQVLNVYRELGMAEAVRFARRQYKMAWRNFDAKRKMVLEKGR